MVFQSGQTGHWDYTNFLGGNIVGGGEDALLKEPPKDPKSYKIYRESLSEQMEAVMGMQQTGKINISAICEARDAKGRRLRRMQPKKEHAGAQFVFSCGHVAIFDPVNPELVRFVPFRSDSTSGYFLCDTCYKLLGRFKLDIYDQVCIKCGLCIAEAITEILALKGDRFIDLRLIKA